MSSKRIDFTKKTPDEVNYDNLVRSLHEHRINFYLMQSIATELNYYSANQMDIYQDSNNTEEQIRVVDPDQVNWIREEKKNWSSKTYGNQDSISTITTYKRAVNYINRIYSVSVNESKLRQRYKKGGLKQLRDDLRNGRY